MVNAIDTRFNALSNNIAGTSEKKKEYTEYETEKDFLDAKSDDGKYDKVEIRNRTVTETETLSLVPDFGKDAKENGNEGEVTGQDPKPEENKMNDDDRTVNEIFSPVADLGQDTKYETEKKDAKTEENKMNDDDDEAQQDTLELRTVNEILSPVADLGQDTKNETEKNAGDPKPKENKKNMEVSEEIRDQGGGGVGGGISTWAYITIFLFYSHPHLHPDHGSP